MIQFLTSFTQEIDDPRIAAAEILNQLNSGPALLKYSVGLLFCSLDFILSGSAEEVCKTLPFEVIGCTTHGIAVPNAMGEHMLSVIALTSDEVFFKVGISDPLDTNGETRIEELYKRLSSLSDASPSLMLICHSNPKSLPGEKAMEVLDHVSGGMPLFGTNALDQTLDVRMPMIVHNGAFYSDRLALILVYGAIESRFYIKSLPEMNIYNKPAFATEVQGNRLISINNIPAADFMEQFGIISGDNINAVYGFPLLIDNHDGRGIKACGIYGTEEDRALRCGIAIAEGATLKLANQMREEVLRISEQLVELIKKDSDRKNHLIFSCFGKSAPLVDLKDEMRLFQENMEENSFVFVLSEGEFCPVAAEGGEVLNCFHQYSIISLSC
jgi:hypothetical protein